MSLHPLPLLLAPIVLVAPLLASQEDPEADLPKVGRTLTTLRGLARSAESEQAARRDAQALLTPLNMRECYILALLLPEIAAEESSELPRRSLLALAEQVKTRAQEQWDYYRDRWPGGECLPAPLDMQRVLAVTGRIATIARNAQREALRRPDGYSEWSWKSPKRKSARKEMRALIDSLDSPKDIYAVAVMLLEYQKDTGGNVEDWLLYQDAEHMPATRLGALGTPEAYTYFLKLHALYGSDGAGSMLYKEMELKYFGPLLTPERRREIEPRAWR